MPWESSFRAGTTGPRALDYWHEHLEENALAVIAKARSLGVFIDGDAPVAADSRHHLPTAGMLTDAMQAGTKRPLAIVDAYPPPPEPRGGGGGGATRGTGSGGPPTKPRPTGRAHSVVNGRFTANRRMTPICVGFQSEACKWSRSIQCPTGDGTIHQCAVCLSADHGADHPSTCTRQASIPSTKRDGGGKGGKGGKNKGRGKY
jgi:hypothetical protein